MPKTALFSPRSWIFPPVERRLNVADMSPWMLAIAHAPAR